MPHISVVAPVYNEVRETLFELTRRLAAAIAPISADFEIILVDDGSQNDAWSTIAEIAAADKRVKGLRLTRNFGQHTAITAGLDHAEGDWVVVMDSDLQDRPEVIPELYRKAHEGYDVVFVNRAARPESALYRLAAMIFYSVLNTLSSQNYDRRQANFSILSRQVVQAFRRVPDRDRFYGGTVSWIGYRKGSIVAQHGERSHGRTTYNLKGRFRFAFRIIFGFSTRLLYAGIVVGLLMALLSFGLAADIVINKLLHPELPVPGWPSVMTAVFFAAGVTNVMLGLVGIYIGNLIDQTKNRPIYIVARTTDEACGERNREIRQ